MSKLKALKEQRATKFSELENLRNQGESRTLNAEEEQRYSALFNEISKLDEKISQEERYLELEKEKVSKNADQRAAKTQEEEERALLKQFLSTGLEDMTSEQRESFTGVSGAVTIPKKLAAQIEVTLKAYGGMFEVAEIITTQGGGDLVMPTINDTASKATIVGEFGEISTAAKTFGSKTLKAYKYAVPTIPLSFELIQDSAYPIEQKITELMADSFGRGTHEHLTTGTGTDQPEGIVTAATACTTKAAKDAIKTSDLLNLMKSLNSAYAKKASFMMNNNTLVELAKLTDSNGRPILFTDYTNALPTKLLGKPVVINDDMPDIGSGTNSVLYGDLSKYKIRLVSEFTTKRLVERYAEYGAVGLMGWGRLDGALLDAGTHPVYKLVHDTTTSTSNQGS